jgi:hypothetical protein
MAMTVAAVDALRIRLAAIPPKDESVREVTRVEAVMRMRGEIVALRGRGYSWEEVAAIVSQEGCQVTTATLRTELSRRGSVAKKKRRKGRSHSGNAAAVATTAPPPVAPAPVVARAAAVPARTLPEVKAGAFVVREDTEL